MSIGIPRSVPTYEDLLVSSKCSLLMNSCNFDFGFTAHVPAVNFS